MNYEKWKDEYYKQYDIETEFLEEEEEEEEEEKLNFTNINYPELKNLIKICKNDKKTPKELLKKLEAIEGCITPKDNPLGLYVCFRGKGHDQH